jgi:hypothetical protein
MTNSRIELGELLTKELPRKFKVIPQPRNTDTIEAKHPVVLVIRTSRKPSPAAMGQYFDEFAIWVIEPKIIDPEDDLDDALDAVILALDAYPNITWTEAERSTYAEENPAYRIAATAVATKE